MPIEARAGPAAPVAMAVVADCNAAPRSGLEAAMIAVAECTNVRDCQRRNQAIDAQTVPDAAAQPD